MEFRDDAQRTIRAPGADAARDAVRRRRRIVTAIGACALAAVLIGAWAAFWPPTDPAPTGAGPTRTPPPITYEASVRTAFERVYFESFEPAWAKIPDAPVWWGPTLAEAGSRTFRYIGSQPGSSITMTASCAGTGSITLHMQTVDGSSETPISCEEDGPPESTVIQTVAPDQTVEVTVRGDEHVSPEGAFVVVMTDPRSVAALSALTGPTGSTEPVTALGTSYDPYGHGTISMRVGPGRYSLVLFCLGDAGAKAGQVRVRVSLDAAEDIDETPCPASGGRLEVEVVSDTGGEIAIAIDESGSFGYAYRLVNLDAAS